MPDLILARLTVRGANYAYPTQHTVDHLWRVFQLARLGAGRVPVVHDDRRDSGRPAMLQAGKHFLKPVRKGNPL